MSMTINSNITSLNASRHLGNASLVMSKILGRLNSGERIKSAADDAAGLAISTRMNGQIRGWNQVTRNLNDGISYAQVADGALSSISTMMQRMREMAVHAANASLSDSDRGALDLEFQYLKTEIDRVSNDTEIFGHKPLIGETLAAKLPSLASIFGAGGGTRIGEISGIVPVAYIPTGATNVSLNINCYTVDDDIQVFTPDGKHLVGTDLQDMVWQWNGVADQNSLKAMVFKRENGFLETAQYDSTNLNSGGAVYNNPPANTSTYNGMTFTYSGDADRIAPSDGNNNGFVTNANPTEMLTIDTVSQDLILFVVGQGNFDASVSWGSMPNVEEPPLEISDGVKITTIPNEHNDQDYIKIGKTPAGTGALSVANASLRPVENAMAAISQLDGAFIKVDDYRAYYGSKLNAMEQQLQVAQQGNMAISAARMRIQDADIARESDDLVKSGIIKQATVAMLAQANLQPQLALQLLGLR